MIQDREAKLLNSLEMGARSVEITVPSKAARKTPIYRLSHNDVRNFPSH